MGYIYSNMETPSGPYEYDLNDPIDRKLDKFTTIEQNSVYKILSEANEKKDGNGEGDKEVLNNTSDQSDMESIVWH